MAIVAVIALIFVAWLVWWALSSGSTNDSGITPEPPSTAARHQASHPTTPGDQASSKAVATSSERDLATDDSKGGAAPATIRKPDLSSISYTAKSSKPVDVSVSNAATTDNAAPVTRQKLLFRKSNIQAEGKSKRKAATNDLNNALEELYKHRRFHGELQASLYQTKQSLNAAEARLTNRKARNLLRPEDPKNHEGPPPEAVEARDRLLEEYNAQAQRLQESSDLLLPLETAVGKARDQLDNIIQTTARDIRVVNAELDNFELEAKKRAPIESKKRVIQKPPIQTTSRGPVVSPSPPPSPVPPSTVPMDSGSIRDAVQRRGIKGLVHFTQIENLGTIAQNGIISRDELSRMGIDAICNDNQRLDRCLDHISVSISWPNWQLFYRFQKQNGMDEQHWCVLIINPNVLWQLPCFFAAENAASSTESHIIESERATAQAFERMFTDEGAQRLGLTRQKLSLADHFPTNHQAEVLVERQIPFDRVMRIIVYDDFGKEFAMQQLPLSCHAMLKKNKEAFQRRSDWTHWIEARRSVEGGVQDVTRAPDYDMFGPDEIPF